MQIKQLKISVVLVLIMTALSACNEKDKTASNSSAAPAADGPAISFVTTQDSSPLVIDKALFSTPEAKQFLSTGKNPYIGNVEAQAKGKKIFNLYSCTQCHGPEAKGQVGPNLTGPDFHYPKNATNKGMFETVWHGTNGGMGAKGLGLMDPTDPKNGITPDELLKVISWIRSQGKVNGNDA